MGSDGLKGESWILSTGEAQKAGPTSSRATTPSDLPSKPAEVISWGGSRWCVSACRTSWLPEIPTWKLEGGFPPTGGSTNNRTMYSRSSRVSRPRETSLRAGWNLLKSLPLVPVELEGREAPQIGHFSFFAKTILTWFRHSRVGHCQSGGNITVLDSDLSAGMSRPGAIAARCWGKGDFEGEAGRPP